MDNTKYCTLDKYISSLKDKRLSGIEKLYKIIEIIRKICMVLGEIHQYGYYCLELSPQDILCTDKEIKIPDKEVLITQRQLQGVMYGNLKYREYIAPEVLVSEGLCTDGDVVDGKKADVFLVGILLYCCVANKKIEIFKPSYIFNGYNICIERVLEDEQVDKFLVCHCYLQDLEQQLVRDYNVCNDEVIDILTDIFTKSICKNVDRRYADMREFAMELGQVEKILLK